MLLQQQGEYKAGPYLQSFFNTGRQSPQFETSFQKLATRFPEKTNLENLVQKLVYQEIIRLHTTFPLFAISRALNLSIREVAKPEDIDTSAQPILDLKVSDCAQQLLKKITGELPVEYGYEIATSPKD